MDLIKIIRTSDIMKTRRLDLTRRYAARPIHMFHAINAKLLIKVAYLFKRYLVIGNNCTLRLLLDSLDLESMNIPNLCILLFSTVDPELAHTVEGLIRNSDAVMLDKHGSLTVGRTLIHAYENLERLEWAAEVSVWARLLGRVETLSEEQIGKLLEIRSALLRKK